MKFTKQDALTFAIGAVAAVGLELGLRLSSLNADGADGPTDLQAFGVSLGVGLLAALGRYLATYLPGVIARQRG